MIPESLTLAELLPKLLPGGIRLNNKAHLAYIVPSESGL
jgi:hypothetical protein